MLGHGFDQTRCHRRRFLGWSLAAAGAMLLPGTKVALAAAAPRQLDFYNLHTGESLRAVYWEGGHYLKDGLAEIDYVLRDFRTGEIAAIDWGRDFSYGRTATVTATTATRLLAIPGAALRELMLDAPAIDAAIRQTAYERMHTAASTT